MTSTYLNVDEEAAAVYLGRRALFLTFVSVRHRSSFANRIYIKRMNTFWKKTLEIRACDTSNRGFPIWTMDLAEVDELDEFV